MTDVTIGNYGAKRETAHEHSPRSLLIDLRRRNPRVTDAKLQKLFTEEVIEDKTFLEPIIAYYFANTLRSILSSDVPAPVKKQKRAEKQKRVEEAKIKLKAKMTQIVLLDLTMANGKMLRDMTGAECRKMGAKTSKWLAAIADKMKPTDVVGKVMSEKDVQAVWKRSA